MLEEFHILDQEELDYIKSLDYDVDFPGLKVIMETPRFTISDLGVAARDATYWDKKDILPEIIGTNTTRRKYTLKQAVWIKLIQQLRSFEVSLAQIKKIKDHLLKPNLHIRELLETEQVNMLIQRLAEKDGKLEEYLKMMKDTSFLKAMEKEQVDIFEIMVLYTIIFRRDASLVVNVDGSCLPYVFDKHELMKEKLPEFEKLMKSPHIVLSLTQAYCQLIQDWSEKKWFSEVSIISKDEKKILSMLREKSTKELKIMKNDNEVDRVIIVQNRAIVAIEEFANHIVRNGYQTITISTRQGKPVHFKNEVSVKLKDIPE